MYVQNINDMQGGNRYIIIYGNSCIIQYIHNTMRFSDCRLQKQVLLIIAVHIYQLKYEL